MNAKKIPLHASGLHMFPISTPGMQMDTVHSTSHTWRADACAGNGSDAATCGSSKPAHLNCSHVVAVRVRCRCQGRRTKRRPPPHRTAGLPLCGDDANCRRRRSTHWLPPPESLAPARLGSGAVAPSPLLALTGGPNSLFIWEESTMKRESIFLSLLCESYSPIG